MNNYFKHKIIILLSVILFSTQINIRFANAQSLVCLPGSINASSVPVNSVPTFDYDSSGLLQFHFKVKTEGWPFTGDIVNIDYNFYNSDCSPKEITRAPQVYSGRMPLVPNLMVKAKQTTPGKYNFIGINEDTGEEIFRALNNTPRDFTADSILSLKFYVAQNFAPPLGFNEIWVYTPAVPVKISVAKPPVLIVPGVLGTELSKDGRLLWADIPRMANPLNLDTFMDPLSFGTDLLPSDSSLLLGKTLDNPFGVFDYTEGLINEFTSQGYEENKDLFLLPYDWRYGVGEKNTNALKDKINQIISVTGSDKVDVIAHSTGGLVLKKYIIDNANHHVGKAVFVGVPHLGAPKAIKTLLQGDNFGIPGLEDAEMKKITANMPVVYDLSPSKKYYTTKGSYVQTITQQGLFPEVKDLNYEETKNFLSSDHNFNSLALENATNLHTLDFDNFDPRTKGVDTYNVVGCTNKATIGKITELRNKTAAGSTFVKGYSIGYVAGDETVPLESATNLPVDSAKKFYTLKIDHGKLMTGNGSRQLITELVTKGTGTNTLSNFSSNVTQDIGKCKLKGKAISIYSPLDLEISDSSGNHAKIAADGSIENSIDGVKLEKFGEHTFAFISEDMIPSVNIGVDGTGTGEYTMKVETMTDNDNNKVEVFNHLPVTENLTGSLNLTGDQAILSVDETGAGTSIQTLTPNATIATATMSDMVAPVTNIITSGKKGLNNSFSGPVSISLQAVDYAQDGIDPSGVFKIRYSLDGSPFETHTAPFTVSSEGRHTVKYAAIDLLGNEEVEKTYDFVIDNKSPEVSVSFDPVKKAFTYTGIDANLSDFNVSSNTITAKDIAGNTTVLSQVQKAQASSASLELSSITYNATKTVLGKNKYSVNWKTDKTGKITSLTQTVSSKNNSFNIISIYNNNQTILTTVSGSTATTELITGIVPVTIKTNQGILSFEIQKSK